MTWNDGKCVGGTGEPCPPGHYLVPNTNGQCCPDGMVYDGWQCVPSAPEPGRYPLEEVCVDGYVWDGTNCTPRVKDSCGSGYTWDGTNCVPVYYQIDPVLETCPPGLVGTWPNCYNPPPPQIPEPCPPNHVWDGNQCISCAGGTIINGICAIEDVLPLECWPGYFWNGSECEQEPQYATDCPDGYVSNGTNCVQTALPDPTPGGGGGAVIPTDGPPATTGGDGLIGADGTIFGFEPMHIGIAAAAIIGLFMFGGKK